MEETNIVVIILNSFHLEVEEKGEREKTDREVDRTDRGERKGRDRKGGREMQKGGEGLEEREEKRQ